jgi:acyl transferase domain-containing protein
LAMTSPKELLFLEMAWLLFENAGYSRASLQSGGKADVGVFVGSMPGTHNHFGRHSQRNPILPPVFTSSLAQRVSGFFDFSGPSLVIDTQSSSSLTAVHLACESLRRGECSMAVAGGVSLLYPELFELFSQAGVIGSRLDSRSFSDGDGLLLAEGAGAVLLKPLSLAEAEGDNVMALVRATAINHAGRARAGMAPNLSAQVQLFKDVLAKAEVDPRSISYVESAANGSAVADQIELAALSRAFGEQSADRQFCALGSVKSNMGHAEAASGISQLSKAVLQLQHRKLVPLFKTERLNPNMRLDTSPFFLQTELRDWHRPVIDVAGQLCEQPRRAMVNSFGAGGAYASAVVEEYAPAVVPQQMHSGPQIVVLSAKTPEQLNTQAQQMLAFLDRTPAVDLADLAYTLQVGREAMGQRVAMVVQSIDGLIAVLNRFLEPSKWSDSDATLFIGRPLVFDPLKEAALRNDADQRPVIEQYIAEHALDKLAASWASGLPIEWQNLHTNATRRRMALPTYPFLRRRLSEEFSRRVDMKSRSHLSGAEKPQGKQRDRAR